MHIKVDLALHNLQWLICHKTKLNQEYWCKIKRQELYAALQLIFLNPLLTMITFARPEPPIIGGSSYGVMVKVLDGYLEVNELKFQSHYYFHFRNNTLAKRYRVNRFNVIFSTTMTMALNNLQRNQTNQSPVLYKYGNYNSLP